MSNLYLMFETPAKRMAFTHGLLLSAYSSGPIPYTRPLYIYDVLDEEKTVFDLLDQGRTKSPYYRLYRRYSFGEIRQPIEGVSRYHPQSVFLMGIRNLYYQSSYRHRPGYWVVVELRDTDGGREIWEWVMNQVPKESIGQNVPLPKAYLAQKQLESAEYLLSIYDTQKKKAPVLKSVLAKLEDVLEKAPELFRGDRIYLWERLAFAFQSLGYLGLMEKSLRTQAKLQPGCADAYLNLGGFLLSHRRVGDAINAYLEGLSIDPNDEYIYYNLSSLLNDVGNFKLAEEAIAKAIAVNPDRLINHKLMGDIYLAAGDWKKAIQAYQDASKCPLDGFPASFLGECLFGAASAYDALQDKEKAREYAETAIKADPDNTIAHQYLAQMYREKGNIAQAKWHERLANRTTKEE